MDKVFISKEDLQNSWNESKKEAGPFSYIFIVFALMVSLVYLIPLIIFYILVLTIYIPFSFLDTLYKRRIK